jgi:hypothetical protein
LVWGVNQLVDAGGIWEEGEGEERENFTLCVHALLYGVVVVGVGGVVEGAAEACCSHFCALGDEVCRIECRGLCVIMSLAWTLLKTEVGKRWLLREGSNICEWWCTAVRPVTMTFGKLGPWTGPWVPRVSGTRPFGLLQHSSPSIACHGVRLFFFLSALDLLNNSSRSI